MRAVDISARVSAAESPPSSLPLRFAHGRVILTASSFFAFIVVPSFPRKVHSKRPDGANVSTSTSTYCTHLAQLASAALGSRRPFAHGLVTRASAFCCRKELPTPRYIHTPAIGQNGFA